MAAAKVEYKRDAATGTHAIGVSQDGFFVPFVSVSDVVFNDAVERARAKGEQAAEEDNGKEG